MASLQTLRNKGGVIVAVVIGLALLAFVLGDLFSSGSRLFGAEQNNVGEIDGTKISYQQYSAQLNYLSEIRKISGSADMGNNDEQSEQLRNQTWEQLIRQYAFKPSLDKLGLTVTEQEMVQLMGGAHTSPLMMQMFANPETGIFDIEELRNFVANIGQDKSGRLEMFWNYLQQEVSDQAQLMKLKNIIDKSVYVTTLEAEKLQKLEGVSRNVRFVAEQYSKLADSTIVVSKDEIKAYYDKNSKMYRGNDSRTIEYVLFEALPSEADRTAADKYVSEMVEEFKQSSNVMQFATLNSQSPMDTRYYKEGELSGDLGKFAFESTTDQIFGPILNGDQYTVARISDVKIMPDSINFSHIALTSLEKAKADSIAEVVRKSGKFEEAAKEFSMDAQSAANGGLMGSFDPQTMPEVFSKPMLNAKNGDILVVETPQSLHVIKVNKRIGDGKKVQLAAIQYTVEPSANTRNLAYSNANEFAAAATKGFDEAVNDKSLVKRVAVMNSNDREMQGVKQSREAVRWAFNSKTGAVSKVMEFGDNFLIASLTKVSEDGILPLSQVEDYVKAALIQQKKSEMLVAKMEGATSVDELASKLSLNIIEAQDVNFTTYIAPEVGVDLAFVGGVCGMDPSKISKPIVGSLAVYAAQVTGSVENPVSLEVMKARLNAEGEQRAFMNAYQTFLEMSSIKDLRYKFY